MFLLKYLFIVLIVYIRNDIALVHTTIYIIKIVTITISKYSNNLTTDYTIDVNRLSFCFAVFCDLNIGSVNS